MEVKFRCECGQKLKVQAEHIGRSLTCPKCRKSVTVPASAEPVGAAAAAPPPSSAAPAPRPVTPEPPPPQPPPAARVPKPGATPQLSLSDLRDSGEQASQVLLTIFAIPAWLGILVLVIASLGLWLIFIGFGVLIGLFVRMFMLAYVKTHAVETSPSQFPELDAAATEICQRLGTAKPQIYVMQDSVWNAWAAKLAGKRIVVLLSGAVDSILLTGDMQQVKWLVGHEIGHHAAGHFSVWRRLIALGGWLPMVLMWHRRRGELTCDNIGLYAAGLDASLKAVANATVGAQLAPRVNVPEAIEQWRRHRGELLVRYRTLYSTHPPHLWRMANLVETAQRLGIAA